MGEGAKTEESASWLEGQMANLHLVRRLFRLRSRSVSWSRLTESLLILRATDISTLKRAKYFESPTAKRAAQMGEREPGGQ